MLPKVYRNITPLTATELRARYFSIIVSPHDAAITWLPDATKNRGVLHLVLFPLFVLNTSNKKSTYLWEAFHQGKSLFEAANSSVDSTVRSQGNTNGSLAHPTRPSMDQHALTTLEASTHHQRIIGLQGRCP